MSKKLKSHFSYNSEVIASGNIEKPIPIQGGFITIYSVVGSVYARFNDADNWVPVFNRVTFTLFGSEQFKTVAFRSVAGGTVNFYSGVGSIEFGGEIGNTGDPQVIIGAVDDPNAAVITPDDPTAPAVYYKDQAAPPIQWNWSVTGQTWFQVLG